MTAAPVSNYARAVDLLAACKINADVHTVDGTALWYALQGIEDLLRNNSSLALPVEAVASRIAAELGIRP